MSDENPEKPPERPPMPDFGLSELGNLPRPLAMVMAHKRLADAVEQDITFYGTGDSVLRFFVSKPNSTWDKPRLVASVWLVGNQIRELSKVSVAEHEARVFLDAIMKSKECWITNGTDRLVYDVTEQGHLFSIWRRGRTRATRRFPVPWSRGVDWAVQLLLQRFDERAKMAE